MERIIGQPSTRHYNEAMEDIDEDDGRESNVDVELETILEIIRNHDVELGRILGRQWTRDDHSRTMDRRLTPSLEEAVNLEIAHLGATGAVADQLAQFGMLKLVCMVHNERKEPTKDYVLCLFEKRHYSVSDGIDKEDCGEECCICLQHLNKGLVAVLHCRHKFHGLRRGKNFCPLCRARAIM
ncbi:hypothetical protein AAHA92_02527 [Salvia divinorum]|uniref:RING-type domain-containing protein n=1 Tax=Salvia divinorum TaxID=28513 RepID=A0ABD1IIA5_SALDI